MRRLLGLPGWLARPVARVLVVALSVATLGPILHDLHEDACEPPLVLHDASQHRYTSTPADDARPAAPDHCVACHLQRAARGPAVLKSSVPPVPYNSTILRHADEVFVVGAAHAPLPARAPPAAA